MSYSPLSISRRHVLGDLYARCDSLEESVPVYLAGDEPALIGQVDERLGHYADAFCFDVAEDICKKLSSGQFTYSFDYVHSDPGGPANRVRLSSITLTSRKGYEKPLPRR